MKRNRSNTWEVSNVLSRGPRAFLPCSGSSQISVGWCVRGLSPLSSPHHSAGVAGAALLPGFGCSLWHSDARIAYSHSEHQFWSCARAQATSQSTCSDVTFFSLNLFVLNVLVWNLSPFIICINSCLVLFDSWSDFFKVCTTGEKWGQVAEEELSCSFSVFSVFLNSWHHSGAFGEFIPGQVLGVFPLRVCILVFLNFRTIWSERCHCRQNKGQGVP